jgi:hypothetical protein
MVRDRGGGQPVAVTLFGGYLDGLARTDTMPDPVVSDNSPSKGALPMAATILEWLLGPLSVAGFPRPFAKRLAAVVSGLLVTTTVRRGDLATAVASLHLSAAKPESIARRLARFLDDPAADPQRLLPTLFSADQLTTLLADEIRAHRANERSGAFHHQRFRPLHLIVDLTTKTDQVVILAVGLAYRGVVLPLAVRTWPQNVTLAEGAYWQNLLSALTEVHQHLPQVLGDHVILVADRAFGVPRMVDAANALGWAFVLRVQGQVRVRLPDGTVTPVRALAAHPGAIWFSGVGRAVLDTDDSPLPPLAVFKDAGWRACQVIAVWDAAAEEPWLLITNLPASRPQVQTYAQRWAIERLFLHWKSHGWDLESLHLRIPARVARLVAGLAIATLWCLLIGAAHADVLLTDLTTRVQQRVAAVYQPPLPGFGSPHPDHRPYPAHYSLLSWGRKVIAMTPFGSQTPAFKAVLPHWQAPIWSLQCTQIMELVA